MEMHPDSFPLLLWHYRVTAVKNTEKFPSVGKYNTGVRYRLFIAASNCAAVTGT